MAKPLGIEVTFITPSTELVIRLMDDNTTIHCTAAQTLKARYFIAADRTVQPPVWGVFDMRTAQKDTPYRGKWSIDDPVKSFPMDARDAAVMWAIMRRRP